MSNVQGHRYVNCLGNGKYFGTVRGKGVLAEWEEMKLERKALTRKVRLHDEGSGKHLECL